MRGSVLLLVLLATLAAPALAQPQGKATGAPPRAPGYLGEDRVPDASLFLPPAPAPGSPTEAADREAFRKTRALQGGPRWTLATADVELAPAAMLADFSCALGTRIDPQRTPSLVRLIARMGRDDSATASHAKDIYRRLRPFTAQSGPTCVPVNADFAASYSYPSGHATYGWSIGLVLAELAPDRAAAVLARARAYGESRVVCGVHYISDVEQGRTTASGLVAVLHGEPAFQADLAAARRELAAARAAPLAQDAPQCRAERDALAKPAW